MAKYKCITKCYYDKRLWIPGETLESSGLPNKHFKPAKRVSVTVEVDEDNVKTFSEINKKRVEEEKKLISAKSVKTNKPNELLN